jgi:hypothetical protein
MPGSTPGVLRDTKLTDFFQRRPSQPGSSDVSSSPFQPCMRGPSLSTLDSNVSPIPTVAKRKPGRPKGSGKSTKVQPGHGVSVSSSQPPFHGGSGTAPAPSSFRLSNSNSPVKRRPGRPKGTRKKAVKYSQDAYLLHSSHRAALRDAILPLNMERSRGLSSPLSSSPQASTPSKRKLDDDDDAASLTSSGVPLSLYYLPRQPSSKGLSNPRRARSPARGPSSNAANKRRRCSPPRSPHSLRFPATPTRSRGNEEVVPTSQPNEVGLYSPTRPDPPRHKSAAHESVENWRHGRSAYRFENVPPLRFSPEGDYSLEIDRPLSPLTSCSPSFSLGSPLSSFSDLDSTFPEAEPNVLLPLSQNTLPSPASTSADRPTLAQGANPSLVRPVTPPPSSPEQEQPTPTPVAPKDSKTKTAEIIKEIWESVRAKSTSDSEDPCLHAPITDELSSEEEDEEPFWKSNKTLAR